jgi:hypothetical protein
VADRHDKPLPVPQRKAGSVFSARALLHRLRAMWS